MLFLETEGREVPQAEGELLAVTLAPTTRAYPVFTVMLALAIEFASAVAELSALDFLSASSFMMSARLRCFGATASVGDAQGEPEREDDDDSVPGVPYYTGATR